MKGCTYKRKKSTSKIKSITWNMLHDSVFIKVLQVFQIPVFSAPALDPDDTFAPDEPASGFLTVSFN
jgi:hypothetical protein